MSFYISSIIFIFLSCVLPIANCKTLQLEYLTNSASAGGDRFFTNLTNAMNLTCTEFDSTCQWHNLKDNAVSLKWFQSSAYLDPGFFKVATGASVVPTGNYAVAASDDPTNTNASAILMSDVVKCPMGTTGFSFMYWLSPKVKLTVCLKSISRTYPNFDFCNDLPSNMSPGPVRVLIPPLQNDSFQIFITASNFISNTGDFQGGFAILDNMNFDLNSCLSPSSPVTQPGIIAVTNATSTSNATSSVPSAAATSTTRGGLSQATGGTTISAGITGGAMTTTTVGGGGSGTVSSMTGAQVSTVTILGGSPTTTTAGVLGVSGSASTTTTVAGATMAAGGTEATTPRPATTAGGSSGLSNASIPATTTTIGGSNAVTGATAGLPSGMSSSAGSASATTTTTAGSATTTTAAGSNAATNAVTTTSAGVMGTGATTPRPATASGGATGAPASGASTMQMPTIPTLIVTPMFTTTTAPATMTAGTGGTVAAGGSGTSSAMGGTASTMAGGTTTTKAAVTGATGSSTMIAIAGSTTTAPVSNAGTTSVAAVSGAVTTTTVAAAAATTTVAPTLILNSVNSVSSAVTTTGMMGTTSPRPASMPAMSSTTVVPNITLLPRDTAGVSLPPTPGKTLELNSTGVSTVPSTATTAPSVAASITTTLLPLMATGSTTLKAATVTSGSAVSGAASTGSTMPAPTGMIATSGMMGTTMAAVVDRSKACAAVTCTFDSSSPCTNALLGTVWKTSSVTLGNDTLSVAPDGVGNTFAYVQGPLRWSRLLLDPFTLDATVNFAFNYKLALQATSTAKLFVYAKRNDSLVETSLANPEPSKTDLGWRNTSAILLPGPYEYIAFEVKGLGTSEIIAIDSTRLTPMFDVQYCSSSASGSSSSSSSTTTNTNATLAG